MNLNFMLVYSIASSTSEQHTLETLNAFQSFDEDDDFFKKILTDVEVKKSVTLITPV